MTKEKWIRLNELLIKNFTQFQQDYIESTKGQTFKKRKLAARNAGFAISRAQWYIENGKGSQLLLEDYLANKPYEVEEFFQPNYFLIDMRGFLEMVDTAIASFQKEIIE